MKPFRAIPFSLALALAASIAFAASVSTSLPIPARAQWDDNNGYCGECSIQTCALYFGTYISQYQCRAIIDTTQKKDVWIDRDGAVIFATLRMNYEMWNDSQSQPQYQKYLAWTKNHLHAGHPVIITVYVQGMDSTDYDHIVPAFGFQSDYDWTAYHAGDTLSFYDNYETDAYVRQFSSLYDTRSMNGNGSEYEYCIPRDVDYGCAMTGIHDDSGTALPVRLSVDRWDEPNLIQGEKAVTLNATVTVQSLGAGKSYTLLRYDDYNKVPVKNFLSSTFNKSWTFKATGTTKTISDQFKSSAVAIYRCVPAAQTTHNAVGEEWALYP